jgi:glycosyltransferase involved in cell wall biosynthesis
MKIVVAVRCRNGENDIARFLYQYSFADQIVVSDGGSEDNSIAMLEKAKKVKLYHFDGRENLGDGYWWNPDAEHMNFVLNKARELEPDWLIFDDLDDVPNHNLKNEARSIFETCNDKQINAFRLYMWGTRQYFPKMNRSFDLDYTSLWAWQPKKLNIQADESIRHGTLIGLDPNPYKILPPLCLLHFSWNPETIEKKLEHYRKVGFAMNHPFQMSNAGTPVDVPEWAKIE